jgi:hypothetical protein
MSEVSSLRSALDGLHLQITQTSQHQGKAAAPFANSISSKQTFCIQTAYGDLNRKPFVTSTTCYDDFDDAMTDFDVYVKRQHDEQQKRDWNNLFNSRSEFYRGYDVYAMCGIKQPAEPVQSSH